MKPHLGRILHKLFPGQCVICSGNSDRMLDLCRGCQRDLPYENKGCWQCGLELKSHSDTCRACQLKPPIFSHCFSLLRYQHPADFLINEFKGRGRLAMGKVLSTLLAHRYLKSHSQQPDFWLPVPLHNKALRKRGFNQAQAISTTLSDITGVPVQTGILKRVRATRSQKTLNANQRIENVKDAFFVTRDMANKHVTIVDDVVTTAATVSEVARVVLASGAADVQVICLARTPEI